MARFEIHRHDTDETNGFDEREEFETVKKLLEENAVEYEAETPETRADGGTATEQPQDEIPTDGVDAEVVDHSDSETVSADETEIIEGSTDEDVIESVEDLEQYPEFRESALNVFDDPEETLPAWMFTEIDHGNNVAIDLNKRGTQVVSRKLGFETTAECEVAAYETDFEYCRYRATVKTQTGEEFEAVGDAHINEQGNDAVDLERLAETRAKKRAVKWASGSGLQALGGGSA